MTPMAAVFPPPPLLGTPSRGGGLGRGPVAKLPLDRFLHGLRIFQDFVIRKSKDSNSPGCQRRIALAVVGSPGWIAMLSAVSFDSQAGGKATEIENVPFNRDLPAEVVSVDDAAAQKEPELSLGVGRLFAHLAREGNQSPGVVALASHGAMIDGAASCVKWPPQPSPLRA